ncbi:MAG: AAA family ATPase [Opitutales bacterium]|nr:AAA family ATPase [Opitutales bacterium]
MAYYLKKFTIRNFRSISDPVTLQFTKGELTILCGPNNNGKTNCLRAMDLFFRMDPKQFQAQKDMPYHITHGSRGGKSQTTFTGTFEDDEGKEYIIKQVYKGKPATLTIILNKSEKKEDQEKARNIINQFQFIFVEANNVNLPELIRKMFTEKILALGMKKNRGQTKARERLQNFQEDCQKVVNKINKNLTE